MLLEDFIYQISFFAGRMLDGETKTYKCDETVYGRYVTVYLLGNGTLALCEVQVLQETGEESQHFNFITQGDDVILMRVIQSNAT